jgi:hypothetical protein
MVCPILSDRQQGADHSCLRTFANKDGNFEIIKSFKATTTGKTEQTCISCNHTRNPEKFTGHENFRTQGGGKKVEKTWLINAPHLYGVRPSGKPQLPIPLRKFYWMSIKSLNQHKIIMG